MACKPRTVMHILCSLILSAVSIILVGVYFGVYANILLDWDQATNCTAVSVARHEFGDSVIGTEQCDQSYVYLTVEMTAIVRGQTVRTRACASEKANALSSASFSGCAMPTRHPYSQYRNFAPDWLCDHCHLTSCDDTETRWSDAVGEILRDTCLVSRNADNDVPFALLRDKQWLPPEYYVMVVIGLGLAFMIPAVVVLSLTALCLFERHPSRKAALNQGTRCGVLVMCGAVTANRRRSTTAPTSVPGSPSDAGRIAAADDFNGHIDKGDYTPHTLLRCSVMVARDLAGLGLVQTLLLVPSCDVTVASGIALTAMTGGILWLMATHAAAAMHRRVRYREPGIMTLGTAAPIVAGIVMTAHRLRMLQYRPRAMRVIGERSAAFRNRFSVFVFVVGAIPLMSPKSCESWLPSLAIWYLVACTLAHPLFTLPEMALCPFEAPRSSLPNRWAAYTPRKPQSRPQQPAPTTASDSSDGAGAGVGAGAGARSPAAASPTGEEKVGDTSTKVQPVSPDEAGEGDGMDGEGGMYAMLKAGHLGPDALADSKPTAPPATP